MLFVFYAGIISVSSLHVCGSSTWQDDGRAQLLLVESLLGPVLHYFSSCCELLPELCF
jgi:hypothetical protein